METLLQYSEMLRFAALLVLFLVSGFVIGRLTASKRDRLRRSDFRRRGIVIYTYINQKAKGPEAHRQYVIYLPRVGKKRAKILIPNHEDLETPLEQSDRVIVTNEVTLRKLAPGHEIRRVNNPKI